MATTCKMSLSQPIVCIGILLLVSELVVSAGEYDATFLQAIDRSQKSRYCGDFLGKMLEIVCNGNYHQLSRRSDETREIETIGNEHLTMQELYAKSRLLAALNPRVRRHNYDRKVGIYEECCVQMCSFNELLGYCGPKQ